MYVPTIDPWAKNQKTFKGTQELYSRAWPCVGDITGFRWPLQNVSLLLKSIKHAKKSTKRTRHTFEDHISCNRAIKHLSNASTHASLTNKSRYTFLSKEPHRPRDPARRSSFAVKVGLQVVHLGPLLLFISPREWRISDSQGKLGPLRCLCDRAPMREDFEGCLSAIRALA